MKKISWPFILCIMLIAAVANAQQSVIQLYSGAAPGSEKWTWNVQESDTNMFNTKVLYNVSHPTLSVFLPDSSSMVATATAVIICPGGGFRTLSIESEGNDVAHWLNKKGITAFVLSYRLVHSATNNPVKEFVEGLNDMKKFDEENDSVVTMATTDAKAALIYVRQHASEFNINPKQIGIIGFSAGGTLAASLAYNHDEKTRPDFAAAIYPYTSAIKKKNVPADAPPLFIVAASDDDLGFAPQSSGLYNDWLTSGHVTELHMYAKGGHGFGMHTQHLPTDTWINRFDDWLQQQDFHKLRNPPGWMKQFTDAQLDDFKNEEEQRLHNDWAFLKRFEDENKKIKSSMPKEQRIVFMGNSITEGWSLIDSNFFAGKPYINRGISGQTTAQMLLRFRQDVIDLKPLVVLILAGTNDIAENNGPTTLENIFGNIVSMAQLAKANNISPVLSSVLPVYDYAWSPGRNPVVKIAKLNEMLKNYAIKNNIVYIDYYSAMVDARKGLKEALTYDGCHPNLAGYKIMDMIAEKAIEEALK